MKRDYSTFVTLPQKTSLNINSQVNIVKKISQINCVFKNTNALVPYGIKGPNVACTLVRVKRRRIGYYLSKSF